jgi:hypothetical protein
LLTRRTRTSPSASTLLTYPSNRGPLVSYIPADLRATTEALASFVAVTDPAIQIGVDSDQLRGNLDPGFGDQVLGFVKGANVWVVEWRAMPDSYILSHARGTGPAVGMREYPAPELQGFFPRGVQCGWQHFRAPHDPLRRLRCAEPCGRDDHARR